MICRMQGCRYNQGCQVILTLLFLVNPVITFSGCQPYIEASGMVRYLKNMCLYTDRAPVNITLHIIDKACPQLTVQNVEWKFLKLDLNRQNKVVSFEAAMANNTLTTNVSDLQFGLQDVGIYRVEVFIRLTDPLTSTNEDKVIIGYLTVGCEYSKKSWIGDCQLVMYKLKDINSKFKKPTDLECKKNCGIVANRNQKVRLTVDCPGCLSILSYKWQVSSCTNSTLCRGNISGYPIVNKMKSFVYPPLDVGTTILQYELFVTVIVEEYPGTNQTHFWEYGGSIVQGTCSISPSTGYSLITDYNISCNGFSMADQSQIWYKVFSNTEDKVQKALRLYKGIYPVINTKLQPGKGNTNYTVWVHVKTRSAKGGASVLTTLTVQVYPASFASSVGEGILDAVTGPLTDGDDGSSSQIGKLLEEGNQDEALQLLGMITSTISEDTVEQDDDMLSQYTQIRSTIIENLLEVNVSNHDLMSTSIVVLNMATEETNQLTQEAQDMAADMYDSLADSMNLFQEDDTEVEVMAGEILSGVVKILDLKIDHGNTQLIPDNTPYSTDDVAMEKVKSVSEKLLKTVRKLSSTVLSQQLSGQEATVVVTDTLIIAVQVLPTESLTGSTMTTSLDETNSTAIVVFPGSLEGLDDGADIGIQILHMKQNPHIWDSTARDVNSDVLSVELTDSQNAELTVSALTIPFQFSLETPETPVIANSSLFVNLIRNQENVTFNVSMSNVMTFNFTMSLGKTTTLRLNPIENIKLKVFISEVKKPTFENVTNLGYLYPDKIHLLNTFAKFDLIEQGLSILKNLGSDKIYFTYNNEHKDITGRYYVGVTVDLDDLGTMETLQAMDDECLGNATVMSCLAQIEIPVLIETKSLGCMYWDDLSQTWSSNGCEVSPYSTDVRLECLCTHMTSFGGSVLVLPNFVDPIGDAALFLTFFDNPVVVTTVIMVWILYFFLIHWARQSDKKDKERAGVISCSDNDPSHKYMYLICVVTGWFRDAGTSANVFFHMKGSKGVSHRCRLSTSARPCFQTGYDDWFLFTTADSLGDLEEVTVWHDNSGTNPQWYLSQVYVKDLQLNHSWTFIYNDWLAADRGSILLTTATIAGISQGELKKKTKHNFMVKTSQDLRDGHLWISIFSKPVQSTFTRVQRLTCALSLVLTTMLTNIMFYGIPTNDPEDQVGGTGTMVISLSAIVIGIESSLIMFPINLIILQLFLKLKQRPTKANMMSLKSKEQIPPDRHSQYADKTVPKVNSANDINLEEYSRPTGKGEEPVPNVRITSESRHQSKFLPWWFLYITWSLVLATCLVSSYFVMLYGLKYGYIRSVEWLLSFLMGFTQSAFVTQPLKVFAVAMVFTLVFKKAVEFEDYGPGVQLDEDEEYVSNICQRPETHLPFNEPLSHKLMEQIKERLKLEWLMNITIRDTCLYIIYLSIVLTMVHGHRNIKQAFKNTLALEDILVNPGCIRLYKCFFLAKADNVERFYQYMYEVAIPNLADMSISDHEYATPGSNHFLVGPYRLRQLRVKKGTCSEKDWILKKFGFAQSECTGPYWLGDEDSQSYDGTWAKPLTESPTPITHWTHQSSWTLKTIPYGGKQATYSGGGYVLTMPKDPSLHEGIMKGIYNSDWIDQYTRAVFLEFTLYNPNADLFSVVIILFEFTNGGAVFPHHQIFSTKLYHYSTDFSVFIAVCEVLYLCFNIAFAYIEYKRYCKLGRKEYFSDFWSYVEILQFSLSYTVIGLFFREWCR